jgi:hypothetical protein
MVGVGQSGFIADRSGCEVYGGFRFDVGLSRFRLGFLRARSLGSRFAEFAMDFGHQSEFLTKKDSPLGRAT